MSLDKAQMIHCCENVIIRKMRILVFQDSVLRVLRRCGLKNFNVAKDAEDAVEMLQSEFQHQDSSFQELGADYGDNSILLCRTSNSEMK